MVICIYSIDKLLMTPEKAQKDPELVLLITLC
jgi:hypothetical protein